MHHNINIALVDDQHLFRQGLASLVEDVPDFNLLMQASSGEELIELLLHAATKPDVLLLDMKLPGISGAEVNQFLQQHYPAIKVIVLSMYEQERFIYRMIEAGVCGYLFKNCDKEELVSAITSVMRSGFYFNTSTMLAMRNAATYKKQGLRNLSNIPIELTERETEVLILICREYTNAEIANQLFISVRTAEGHRNSLLAKTGCKNSAGLVVFAVKHALFDVMAG